MNNRAFGRLQKLVSKRPVLYDFGDYRKTVILAGSGRSGTTWVEEIINAQGNRRIMFEPFNTKKVTLFSNWNYRQYLRCSNREDKFLKPATAVLNGNIRNRWVDKFNGICFPRKRLIKDIRAHLILKWIKNRFPEIPIILLLRHPCAVANSKLKLGWDTHLTEFLTQDDLMKDYLNPFKTEMENSEDIFDKHVFTWCVENFVPLKQFSKEEIQVIFYEDLCRNPEDTIKQIYAFIGEKFSTAVLEKADQPSALSREHSAITLETDLVGSWNANIEQCQTERAIKILEIFGLHKIYGHGNLPLLNGSEALDIFNEVK